MFVCLLVRYEGEYQHGRMQGEGTMSYADGAEYVGGFKDDLMHGTGKMRFASENEYEGGYRQGSVRQSVSRT